MNFRNISHIAIGVRDMERSLKFYRDILGLHVSADRIETFPQGPGEEPARRRAVFLRWEEQPHATYILLDQQLTKERVGQAKAIYEAGIHHFGFWVDDIKAVMARAKASGLAIEIINEDYVGSDSEWYGEPPGQGMIRYVIMKDPEGNVVQIDERD